MQRIVIAGNAGSGKSTFARRLGERLAIPVVSLDTLAWAPGWQSVSTPMPRADLFIWVERSVWACVARVLRRAVRGHFRNGENLAAGCRERFDRRLWNRLRFIRNFGRRNRPKIEAARLQHGPDVPVVHLRGDAGIAAFLASCAAS